MRKVDLQLDKRENAIQYLNRWDSFNSRKMEVLATYLKIKRKQDGIIKVGQKIEIGDVIIGKVLYTNKNDIETQKDISICIYTFYYN